MAAIAELRLALDQHVLLFLSVMGRVAVEAADITAGMGGLGKVRLLATFAVAAQAAGAGLLARVIFEDVNLRFVAAPRHVVGAGTMAALTTLLGGAAFLVQRGLRMRGFLPGIVGFFVTGFAGRRPHILGAVGGKHAGRRWTAVPTVLTDSLLAHLPRNQGRDEKE